MEFQLFLSMRPHPALLLGLLGSLCPLLAQADPTPFHLQGTVDPASVSVESVEGETTRRALSWYSKPVMARDSEGNFYVGNKRTLTKLDPEGTALWKVTHERIDVTPTEHTPGASTETWDFDQLAGDGINYDGWNRDNSHHSEHWGPDVVDDIDIVEILFTEHQVLVVARVVVGFGPRVVLASFAPDGMFHWRQVTSVGGSAPVGKDYITTLVDESADTIHVLESGEDLGSPYGQRPASQVTEIALYDGSRGTAHTFGYNGSEPPQYKNHRILKALLLPDGRIAWIARTSDEWLESFWQDYHQYRVEIYDPEGIKIDASIPFEISTGEPWQTGHVQRAVADIAMDGDSRLLVLANQKEQLAGPPFHRYDYKIYGFQFHSGNESNPLQDLWICEPEGEEFADRMIVKDGKATLVGKSDDYLRFPGWMLSRHVLNGDSTPSGGWLRSLPFESPYYRVDNYSAVRDMAVDPHGNVYLTAVHAENDPDWNVLLDPVLCYVKYSDAGHLQFFRPLPGYDISDTLNVPVNAGNASPAQLLIDPAIPASSSDPAYHVFGLATTLETTETMVEASTKKWHLLYLEQKTNVAAPPLDFGAPSTPTPGYGSVVNGTTLRTQGNNLQAVFSTTGMPYRVWVEEGTLPAGMFFMHGRQDDDLYGLLSGPIEAPYGTYTFTVHASDAHGTVSREFTIQHPAPAPVDILRPGLALSGPKSTKKPSIAVQGVAGDDIRVASVHYRVKFGKGKFSGSKAVKLTAGTVLRRFKQVVPTKKKGTYKIEFTVKDGTGKQTVKVFTCNRK